MSMKILSDKSSLLKSLKKKKQLLCLYGFT